MIAWLLNLLGLLRVVALRQRSYLGLVLALMAGFVIAVALVASIPLYAEAVGYRVLRAEVEPDAAGMRRPPFAYMFTRSAGTKGAMPLDEYRRADAYLSSSAARDLGLPATVAVRNAATDKLRLLPADRAAANAAEPLRWVGVGFAGEIESKIAIVDGAWPRGGDAASPVEVLMSQPLADTLGVQVGERYHVLERDDPDLSRPIQIPVRVAGIWRALDEDDPYWFIRPASLEDQLLVPEATFDERVLGQGPRALYQAIWYFVLDGESVRSRHVPGLLARSQATLRRADGLLPGMELRVSPVRALERQVRQVRLLTISLIVFSIPILGMIAYFVVMVAGMVVQRQQNEIAVLRSRGASRAEVLGIYLLEGLVLGALALALGLFLARYAALLMGWTRSFLRFAPRGDVPIEVSPESLRNGLWVLALALLASVLPALGAAGHTIISYKQERARAIRRPLWQRAYVDLLLLIPAYYGYRLLRDRRSIDPAADPFSDPLLILTPALWMLALALLCARVFPILMGAAGRIVARLPGISGLLALRYLTRTPRAYTGPVLLLIFTLSLATFTASMARTLDRHLDDQVHYEVGSDVRVADLGQDMAPPGPPGQPAPEEAPEEAEGPRWLFLPVTEYLRIPGVDAATRVGRSAAHIAAGGPRGPATVLGIDRLDFPRVAHWRDDYAPESLGGLMNALGARYDGLLASRASGIPPGTKLTLSLRNVDETRQVQFVVVGVVDYFPTLYAEDGPFFVGNLDYLFEQQGSEYPYEVWLDVAPGTTREQLEQGVAELGLRSLVSQEAPPALLRAEERPERQGLYGLLSVGFLAAALLTGLGFLFYSVISFQRRFVELGMLRAIGLSVRQMALLLLCEQALIVGMGIAAGTSIGVGVSRVFIPFLQVASGRYPRTPPFLVLVAWDQIRLIYLIFAVLLGLALAIVAVLLLRMKIFQAVKLGEAT